MNYTRKSFTVGPGSSKEYADNWERTFRSEQPSGMSPCKACGTLEFKVDLLTGTVVCRKCEAVVEPEPSIG